MDELGQYVGVVLLALGFRVFRLAMRFRRSGCTVGKDQVGALAQSSGFRRTWHLFVKV